MFNNMIRIGLLLLITFLCFGEAKAQEFGVITNEVRQKMDDNKVQGQSVWIGITTSYTVYTQGLTQSNIALLFNRLGENPSVKGYEMLDETRVLVNTLGGTSFDLIKPEFSNLVTTISQIEIEHTVE